MSQALPLLAESLGLLQSIGDKPALIDGLMWRCGQPSNIGQLELAARIAGAAAASRAALGLSQSPAEDTARQQVIATMRIALGESAFTAAEAAGQTLSPEQAVEDALRIGNGLG